MNEAREALADWRTVYLRDLGPRPDVWLPDSGLETEWLEHEAGAAQRVRLDVRGTTAWSAPTRDQPSLREQAALGFHVWLTSRDGQQALRTWGYRGLDQ